MCRLSNSFSKFKPTAYIIGSLIQVRSKSTYSGKSTSFKIQQWVDVGAQNWFWYLVCINSGLILLYQCFVWNHRRPRRSGTYFVVVFEIRYGVPPLRDTVKEKRSSPRFITAFRLSYAPSSDTVATDRYEGRSKSFATRVQNSNELQIT